VIVFFPYAILFFLLTFYSENVVPDVDADLVFVNTRQLDFGYNLVLLRIYIDTVMPDLLFLLK
jgi:hypothetical protein